MIWESVTLMTVIDVAVVGAVGYALWVFYHQRRKFPGPATFHGFSVLLLGVLSIALFYLFDLVAMHLLPLFVPMSKSMAVMKDLHLNYHWIVTLFAVVAITLVLLSPTRIWPAYIVALFSGLIWAALRFGPRGATA